MATPDRAVKEAGAQAGDGNQVRISLIIPSYRREALLRATLDSALRQERSDYEIIVVDQTPEHEPETDRYFRQHAERIRRLVLHEPSVTRARNAGIRAARGGVLVFVDDDTSFEADFLSRHYECYRSGVGAVQGRVSEKKGRVQNRPTWISRWIKFSGGDDCSHDGRTNNITGCNFSVAREAVARVGEFDMRYTGVAVREESDYALRLVEAGYAIRFSAAARVWHHRADAGGHGAGGRALFFNELYYFNEFLFAKKHFSRPAVWLYRLRLKRRGRRALAELATQAERKAERALGNK